jgi:large subunit ribosomal protein L28
MAKDAGIDLWKLPFEDARPERLAYLQQNKGKVPVADNTRAIKNPKKIAASTKKPRYPVYEEGGRIVYIRPGMEDLIFGSSGAEQQEQELKITLSE